ncbi:MAG: RNB domain-containing ribonuclease, partial [Chitinophagaceae bacterium]
MFSSEVLLESESLKEEIPEEELKKRKDIREIFTITIDPADAKDFDDAISFRRLPDGNLEIGVHIADVSHFVLPQTALDQEAFKRSTSVYLTDRVLPMLPEKISNGLCSLRPHEDKLCFSAIFKMDPQANVLEFWLGRTAIHSNHRYSYEDAQEIIDQGKGIFSEEILELNRISQKLRSQRFLDGAINFSSQEIRFLLDEDAVPIGITIKENKEAHQLIEELMLLANKTVAEYVSKIRINHLNVPFPYRVHDRPDKEKFGVFAAFAGRFGYN